MDSVVVRRPPGVFIGFFGYMSAILVGVTMNSAIETAAAPDG